MKPERLYSKDKEDAAIFSSSKEKLLGLIQTQEKISAQNVASFINKVLEMGTPAGLIISTRDQPFRLYPIERSLGCWFPVAIWGKKQIDAIASLNSNLLQKIMPFSEYFSTRKSKKPKKLGKGATLSSDIVNFSQLGIALGKIWTNPAEARKKLVLRINSCFNSSGGSKAEYMQKVGSDGWFYFFKKPSSSEAVKLALAVRNPVNKYASELLQHGQKLKIVMAVNPVENAELDPLGGGPLDDDSITAFKLLKKDYEKYDIRATEQAVFQLVEAPKRKDWVQYHNYTHPDGRNIEVYGHQW